MSEQIRLFNIPVSDLSNVNFEINITDSVASDTGQDIVSFMRNRDLESSWLTTDSDDTANTEIMCDINDSTTVDDLFLIGHNFKTFDIDYWDGSAWVNIATVVGNALDFYHLELPTAIVTTRIRITVYATIIANADKSVSRLIVAEKMLTGQFLTWPIIDKPTHGTVRKDSQMLSGKHFISEGVGAFSFRLKWDGGLTQQADINLIERMFFWRRPFLIWLCGGDEDQFRFSMRGYREEDFYLVKPRKDYTNAYWKGLYRKMVPNTIDLVEVTE